MANSDKIFNLVKLYYNDRMQAFDLGKLYSGGYTKDFELN